LQIVQASEKALAYIQSVDKAAFESNEMPRGDDLEKNQKQSLTPSASTPSASGPASSGPRR